MYKRIGAAWLIISILVLLAGCGNSVEVDTGEVELMVTRDFGEEDLYSGVFELSSEISVMELLKQNLEIETEYGGGFVNAINGLRSGYTNAAGKEKLDWFYFVNGIMTNVGATDYYPVAQDVIWWDYHPWGKIPFTPAVVGAFPQPFLNGFKGNNPGTLILTGEGCEDFGRDLAEYLASVGVEQVELAPYEESLASNREKMVIVVALWEELAGSGFWQGIQEHRDKTGWFAELETGAFHALDEEARRVETYDRHVGAILATGMGMGDSTSLWLVTGLDEAGIEEAVDILLNRQGELSRRFGVLIHRQEVIGLPINLEA